VTWDAGTSAGSADVPGHCVSRLLALRLLPLGNGDHARQSPVRLAVAGGRNVQIAAGTSRGWRLRLGAPPAKITTGPVPDPDSAKVFCLPMQQR